MMGKLRTALDHDLDLMKSRDLLRGRDALVEHARALADNLDLTYPRQTPQMAAQFLAALTALGIGRITLDSDGSDFDKLMSSMGAQP